MTQHHKTAADDIPVESSDLKGAQDDIQMTQEDLHETLEKLIDALDDGTPIDAKLYQEAEGNIQRLEAEANSLRKDLKKLQKQEQAAH